MHSRIDSLSRFQKAKLHQLALKEAINRQAQNGIDLRRNLNKDAGPSSKTVETIKTQEDNDTQLESLLKEEKAKNDVEWERVRSTLEALKVPERQHDERFSKAAQLALLEYEISVLKEELPKLGPPMNELAMTLYTRSILESSIEQHEAGLVFKRQDLQEEQRRLEHDEATWHQLQQVQKGLEMRKAKLIEKENQRRNPDNIVRLMQTKVDAVEENINELLTSLISISDSLFAEEDGDKRRQLRHLIDRLVNAAWDSPDNPWINVEDQYMPSIVTFLIRANIAVEHPRDARSVRLVQFFR